MTERKYRMMRLRAGDYLCPSNDGEWLWRFHTHVDGRAHGLEDADYDERTFWRAVRVEMDHAKRLGIEQLAQSDPWERPWIEADWYLPTRKAAVEVMLRKGAGR